MVLLVVYRSAMVMQIAGHDALQRQFMYEWERGLLSGLGATGAAGLAASQHLQQLQQEEYFR